MKSRYVESILIILSDSFTEVGFKKNCVSVGLTNSKNITIRGEIVMPEFVFNQFHRSTVQKCLNHTLRRLKTLSKLEKKSFLSIFYILHGEFVEEIDIGSTIIEKFLICTILYCSISNVRTKSMIFILYYNVIFFIQLCLKSYSCKDLPMYP